MYRISAGSGNVNTGAVNGGSGGMTISLSSSGSGDVNTGAVNVGSGDMTMSLGSSGSGDVNTGDVNGGFSDVTTQDPVLPWCNTAEDLGVLADQSLMERASSRRSARKLAASLSFHNKSNVQKNTFFEERE
jgi:hypothetical protein